LITSQKYDTEINVLGGLASTSELLEAETYGLESLVGANLRTFESRGRVGRTIRTAVLQYRSDEHAGLIQNFFSSLAPTPDREKVFFWHLALNNRLFREVSTGALAKAYFAGRAGIKKDDILGYLKECVMRSEDFDLEWAESTIDRLATKYLNLLTKLGFLSGSRSKTFVPIRLSGEALTLFLYLARIHQPEHRNLFKHDLLPLCFVSPDELVERLKKLCQNRAFSIEFSGNALNFDLLLPINELPHVLYR
jgi:hypothetical protein